jgi:hypothetical protein
MGDVRFRGPVIAIALAELPPIGCGGSQQLCPSSIRQDPSALALLVIPVIRRIWGDAHNCLRNYSYLMISSVSDVLVGCPSPTTANSGKKHDGEEAR